MMKLDLLRSTEMYYPVRRVEGQAARQASAALLEIAEYVNDGDSDDFAAALGWNLAVAGLLWAGSTMSSDRRGP